MSMPATQGQANPDPFMLLKKLLALIQAIAKLVLVRRGQINRCIDDGDLVNEAFLHINEEIKVEYPDQTLEDFLAVTLSDPPADPEKLTWLRKQIIRTTTAALARQVRRPGSKQNASNRPRKPKEINNIDIFDIDMNTEYTEEDPEKRFLELRKAITQLLKHPDLSSRQRQVLRWKYKLSTPKRVASHLEVARKMGIQPSTVRDHWKQIVKRIRKKPPTRARE
jgi:RNA polymerase sigma factor (sigma-70 family)